MTKSDIHEEIRIPKSEGSEKVARERARLLASSVGFSPEKTEDIVTAVGEACLNAIEHTLCQNADDTVHVRITCKASAMTVSVSSKGKPFVLSDSKPDIAAKIEGRDRPRGWGLFLMRQLANQVVVENENEVTTVKMKFLLNNAAPSERSSL